MRRRLILITLVLAGWVGLAGCSRLPEHSYVAETEEPSFEEGMRLKRQGREQEALAAFHKVVESRPQGAPESHLELGLIYQKKDPLAAIYHFRRYTELVPRTDDRLQRVTDQIRAAEREFARSLPARPLESQELRNDLMDMVTRLQEENAQLRRDLESARGMPVTVLSGPVTSRSPISPVSEPSPALANSPAPTAAPPPAASPTRTAPRIHTVVKGDTLYNLARQYYNNSTRAKDIYAANRDKMKSDSDLQIGMQLIIPD